MDRQMQDGFYEVEDATIISDVADALARDTLRESPVMVAARRKDLCHISVRVPGEQSFSLGAVVHEAAVRCGGLGGGHHKRAGATVSCARLEEFREAFARAVAA